MSVRAAAGRLARRLLGDGARHTETAGRTRFAIASLPRSGSTAAYRVLLSDPATSISYEPGFFDLGGDARAIGKRAAGLFRRFTGLKHVWDPNGWPFANPDHRSTLEGLENSGELVALNAAVLAPASRIALIRRRDAFARTLSDLWGQQTNLWGHDHTRAHDPAEAEQYRAAVGRHEPAPIDPELFGWYMRHAEAWEDAIVAALPSGNVRTFLYEDLFAATRRDGDIAPAWHGLAEWLGVSPDFASPEVRAIVAPASKLNSAEIYQRIPNYHELLAAFGGSGRA